MSEPNSEPHEDERNPFADIIDLFRESTDKDATGRTSAAGAADPGGDPGPAPVPAPVPSPERGGIPVTRTPKQPAPTPSRGRRAAMLLPVVLLGIAGGATAAVIGHQHHSPAHTATPDPASGSGPIAASPTAASSLPPSAAPVTDTADAAYTSALDGFAAATDVTSLRTAADGATATLAQVRAAGGALHRAEARHLRALIAVATLPGGKQALTAFPPAATAATAGAAKVTAVGGSNPAVPDPSLATTTTVTVEGVQVAAALHARVTALAAGAAKATLTADLRRVAAQAGRLTGPAAGTAGLLAGQPAFQATADAAALRALAGMSVIDADHLGAWRKLAGPVQDALAKAGVADASQDVTAITTMIGKAQQTLLAWAASNPSGTPSPDAASKAAARATKKAIRSYASTAQALVGRYSQIIGGLPQVAPGQEPSFSLTTRFYRSLGALNALSGSVSRLKAPTGMAVAQQALAGLVSGGRAVALAGHAVAVSAEDCDPSTRSCVYGSMRGWPTYVAAMQRLGSASTVAKTISTAEKSALASAAAQASATPSPAASAPPKPVV